MLEDLSDFNRNNLDPQHFVFWRPPVGHMIHVGPDRQSVPLPQIPFPIKLKNMVDGPSDNAVGEGAYDYLRQFPDCLHNTDYAVLLRDSYPHFLADLAAHVVMLDKKDVEPAYVFRKLTYLKILCLLEPENVGLLRQLLLGFYGLAMTFTELPQVRRHLLDAMRFGQKLLKLRPDDQTALNLLAEVDILFGDYPAAIVRLHHLIESSSDQHSRDRARARLEACLEVGLPDHPLLDDLDLVGKAMQFYAEQDYLMATELLERLEEDLYFMSELRSADFLCLLGMCRLKTNDSAGAFDALSQALEIAPEHKQARESIELI
jgi:tetratricopeptide (TPR) repeat protein